MTINHLRKNRLAHNKDEWIAYRNERSLTPWDAILASGFDAVRCDCGKEGCLGWRLAHVPFAPAERSPRSPPSPTPPNPPNPPRAA